MAAKAEDGEAGSGKIADPFLAALVASDDKIRDDVCKRELHLREEFDGAEVALQHKADATAAKFKQLLVTINVRCRFNTQMLFAACCAGSTTSSYLLNVEPLAQCLRESLCFVPLVLGGPPAPS